MNATVPTPPAGHCRQQGAALISALLMLLVVTVLAMALNTLSASDTSVSSNTQNSQEALALAESGAAHALAIISWPNTMFDYFLAGGEDASGCTGDELTGKLAKDAKKPKDWPKDYPKDFGEFIPADGVAYGAGRYTVRVCDDDAAEATLTPPDNDPNNDHNGRILVRSTGTGPNGAVAAVEVTLGYTAGFPAVMVNGNLRLEDHPRALGEQGGFYASGFMELEHEPCADTAFSASGPILKPDHSRRGPDCKERGFVQEFTPAATFPNLTIANYKTFANFVLGDDGHVYLPDGTHVFDARTTQWPEKDAWQWEAGEMRWKARRKVTPGIYYTPANIKIEDDLGKGKPGWNITLIAEGYIEVRGVVKVDGAMLTTTADPVNAPVPPLGITLLAGTDIKLAHNGFIGGIVYARNQIGIENQFSLAGQIVVLNIADEDPPGKKKNLIPWVDKEHKQVLKGDWDVTYDGGGFDPAGTVIGPQILSWRECRGANPADPCG